MSVLKYLKESLDTKKYQNELGYIDWKVVNPDYRYEFDDENSSFWDKADKWFTINMIETKEKFQGNGKILLKQWIDTLPNNSGIVINANPIQDENPEHDMTIHQLTNWYKKLGFKEIAPHNTSLYMIKNEELTERQDIEVVTKVDKLTKKIMAFLKKWRTKIDQLVVKNDDLFILTVRVIDPDYSDLYIAFRNKNGTAEGSFKPVSDKMKLIYLNCLTNNDINDLKVILKQTGRSLKYNTMNNTFTISSIQDTLSHELVHYFDNKKYDLEATYKTINGDLQKYFSLPAEYNAFWNTAAINMLSVLKESETLRQIFFSDFNKFKEYFMDSALQYGVIKMMTPEMKNRVLKRVYAFWEECKKYFEKKSKVKAPNIVRIPPQFKDIT